MGGTDRSVCRWFLLAGRLFGGYSRCTRERQTSHCHAEEIKKKGCATDSTLPQKAFFTLKVLPEEKGTRRKQVAVVRSE